MESEQPISRHELRDLVASAPMRTQIETITAESYSNGSVLLDQEYHKNNRVYTYVDVRGRIVGFFMVGWAEVSGITGSTVFLGLSLVSNSQKGHGVGKKLYSAFFIDALAHEQSMESPVLWWGHTATPVAANAMWSLVPYIAPRADGSFGDSDLTNLEALKRHFGMTDYSCPLHPFVLRGYAKARYSPIEAARIAGIRTASEGSHLLSRLGVIEENGDRMILLGRPPGSRFGVDTSSL